MLNRPGCADDKSAKQGDFHLSISISCIDARFTGNTMEAIAIILEVIINDCKVKYLSNKRLTVTI